MVRLLLLAYFFIWVFPTVLTHAGLDCWDILACSPVSLLA